VRGLIGAAVGLLVGVGFVLSWNALPPNRCDPTGRGGFCIDGRVFAAPILVLVWALVATALLAFTLRRTEPEPAWPAAAGLGCVLWVALGVGAGMLGLAVGSDVAKVLVPCFAYAVAALCTSREPTW
jgi:hypothetical protein